MKILFHFIDGDILEEETDNWATVIIGLQKRGMRFYNTKQNKLLPIESGTLKYIELVDDEEDEEDVREGSESVSPEEEGQVLEHRDERTDGEVESEAERDTRAEVQEDDRTVEEGHGEEISIEERNKKIIEHMKEMSSCTHENHDIYFQTTTVGRAKAPAKRYFPVCAKCGVRERYVKASDLTDEQRENAKEWDK